MRKTILGVALACVVLALGVSAAGAARPKAGAVYGTKTPPDVPRETKDNSLKLRVAGNAKTFDAIGPHEACAYQLPGGAWLGSFNPFERLYPKVDDVRIASDGSFKGSENYEQLSDTGNVTYIFAVRIKGRFTDSNTAKGAFTWTMKVGGQRGGGAVSTCEDSPNTVTFAAKRGNNPGRYKRWHPAGKAPR
jgi:hypothetical protein